MAIPSPASMEWDWEMMLSEEDREALLEELAELQAEIASARDAMAQA